MSLSRQTGSGPQGVFSDKREVFTIPSKDLCSMDDRVPTGVKSEVA